MPNSDTASSASDVLASEVEAIRLKSAALSQRLAALKDTTEDAALREELADLAAQMVAITAKREGPTSPILQLLDNNESEPSSSLARRAADKLSAQTA